MKVLLCIVTNYWVLGGAGLLSLGILNVLDYQDKEKELMVCEEMVEEELWPREVCD